MVFVLMSRVRKEQIKDSTTTDRGTEKWILTAWCNKQTGGYAHTQSRRCWYLIKLKMSATIKRIVFIWQKNKKMYCTDTIIIIIVIMCEKDNVTTKRTIVTAQKLVVLRARARVYMWDDERLNTRSAPFLLFFWSVIHPQTVEILNVLRLSLYDLYRTIGLPLLIHGLNIVHTLSLNLLLKSRRKCINYKVKHYCIVKPFTN